MEYLIFALVVVSLTVVPIMIAAKILKAGKSSFWACLAAVIASVAAENLASAFVTDPIYSGLIALAFTAIAFAFILEAKFIQSTLIAILSVGIQLGVAFVLASFGLAAVGINTGV